MVNRDYLGLNVLFRDSKGPKYMTRREARVHSPTSSPLRVVVVSVPLAGRLLVAF